MKNLVMPPKDPTKNASLLAVHIRGWLLDSGAPKYYIEAAERVIDFIDDVCKPALESAALPVESVTVDKVSTTLMTSDEVAAQLQVSKKTLSQWRWRKQIPFVRLNGAVRYRQSDIEAMITDAAKPAKDPPSVAGQPRKSRSCCCDNCVAGVSDEYGHRFGGD